MPGIFTRQRRTPTAWDHPFGRPIIVRLPFLFSRVAPVEESEKSGRRFVPSPLTVALALAVLGVVLIAGALAWGVAPWVGVLVLGALCLAAAFTVDSPRRTPPPRRRQV
jgi:uncharacterized membrane protein YphA (DoxX/SURF4 family)